MFVKKLHFSPRVSTRRSSFIRLHYLIYLLHPIIVGLLVTIVSYNFFYSWQLGSKGRLFFFFSPNKSLLNCCSRVGIIVPEFILMNLFFSSNLIKSKLAKFKSTV